MHDSRLDLQNQVRRLPRLGVTRWQRKAGHIAERKGSGEQTTLISPRGGVDTVLIANSYHEFTEPLAILDHRFRALRSGGRLVVLDRGPRSSHGESREIQMQQYQIAASIVEDEFRQRGFQIVSRDDRFIDRPATERLGDRPDDHVW